MRNLNALLLLLLAGISFASCKRADTGPQLPELTHEGKNTIAWEIDGKVFVSQGPGPFFDNKSNFTLFGDSILIINGISGAGTGIQLICSYNGINNALKMSKAYPRVGKIFDYLDAAGGLVPTENQNRYQTNDTHTGTVIVTYYDSTIIAGTFQMDVVNEAGEVKHITEGRFDIGPDR